MVDVREGSEREKVQDQELSMETPGKGLEQESRVEVQETGVSSQESAVSEQQEVQQAQELAQEVAPAGTVEPVQPKSPVLIDLEGILSEGLGDIYTNLPPEKKQPFKEKGEQIAQEIQQMVLTGKVKARRVLDLIKEWLRMIPGVNKFFLEQEAKIKADGIIDYIEANINAPQNDL